jgi:hypothetical protein
MATENTTQSGMGASTGTAQSGMNYAGSTGNTGDAANTSAGAEGIGGMARNLASQAQQKAGEQVRSSVDKGRNRAADTLQEVARTLMQSGEGEENPAAPYMNRAGEQVQRVADYLRDSDVRQMVSGAEQFARRQPVLFLGTAFAIGVIAARFLKSTRQGGDRYDSGYGMDDDSRYDRERSLASYREADYNTGYSTGDLTGGMTSGMTGAAGSGMSGGMSGGISGGLGGDMGGDDTLDDASWPNSTGGRSSDNGPTGGR